MILITPHFRVSEFDCKDGTPYPEEWIESRLQPLANLLEEIRADVDMPIVVVSGYRSPAYNQRIKKRRGDKSGVATSSQHVEGRAADISCPGIAVDELRDIILSMHRHGRLLGLGGVGFYPRSGWVHVDTFKAPDGHLRRWTGK